jgi:hypothetical protein
VCAGGGDGDGAFDGLLAADVGEVPWGSQLGGFIDLAVELVGVEGELFVEEGDGLGEVGDGIDLEAFDDGGFAGVLFGEDDAAELLVLSEESEGECTFDLADTAVKGELAGDEEILVAVVLDGVGGAEEADGHGEIERGAFFFDVGGCEVDDELMDGEGVAAVDDGAADAFDGLFDGGLCEADDESFFEALFADIDFDFTKDGVDADEDEAMDSGKQVVNPWVKELARL